MNPVPTLSLNPASFKGIHPWYTIDKGMTKSELRESLQWSVPMAIGSFVIFFIASRMLFSSLNDLVLQISRERAILFNYANAPSILVSMKQEKERADPYANAISQMLPNQEGLLTKKSWAESLMRVYNLSGEFSFNNPVPAQPGSLGYAPFNITVNGSYSDIRMFLRTIEVNDPRFFISLDNLQIVRSQGIYRAVVAGKCFYIDGAKTVE
jgi:hypothetical protein